jgi:nicotinamide-nucleotide amidase
VGLSESAVDEAVSEFFNGEDHDFGIYSKPDGIHLRVIVQAKDTVAGQALIKPIEDSIKARLGPYIWGYDYESPEEAACDVLKRRGLTLATMESSGGGSLANSITDVHDSYKYYLCGVVACTDDMKIANGVPSKIIRRHGGVSQETATAMASAVRERFGASFGVGIAESIEPSNAVGKLGRRAYIGIVGDNRVKELELRLVPNRVVAKHRIATTALIELRRLITGTA